MPGGWPTLSYADWSATCDTLHAHTQVLGKLAAVLGPPEPQLQHAALRLTARGWETAPLPAPDGSGALVVALDLRTHEAVAEHSDGRVLRVALALHRPVGEVTREVLAAHPAPEGFETATLAPAAARWEDCARRVRPGLARRLREPRSARGRARVRPLGVPSRVRGVRLGSGARRQRRGHAPARRLTRC
jgi:hypothetical protein